MPKIVGSATIDFRNKYAKQIGRDGIREEMLDLATAQQKQAQINVSPGMGPGPHPHPGRIDTGFSREHIYVDVSESVNGVTAYVFTDPKAFWLIYLEQGWNTKNGKFYRYPWLLPALVSANAAWQIRAGRKFKITTHSD